MVICDVHFITMITNANGVGVGGEGGGGGGRGGGRKLRSSAQSV